MVIQRWQSLLLLAAAVAMACFGFLHHRADFNGRLLFGSFLAWIQLRGHTYRRRTLRMVPAHLVLFVVAVLDAILPLSAIFMFKTSGSEETAHHRLHAPVQAGFCIALLLGYNAIDESAVSWNYSVLCAPVIAVVALWLAWRYICRDRRLLASTDRLR